MNIVGVDIGGTFTDLVGCVDGRIVTSKTSTVPADPTRGVADSLALAHCEMPALVGAAARLDHRHQHGAGAQGRAHRADHHARLPRHLRDRPRQPDRGVQPVLPPAEAADSARADLRGHRADERQGRGARRRSTRPRCRRWRRRSRRTSIEAVAVCFLHAYANPAHERRVGEILRAANPELFVTLSHEIVREYREYERTSTTALNAFVGPRVQTYLGRLESLSARREVRRQDQHHALERRRDVDAARAGAAGVDDGIRPGRRHDRRGPARARCWASSAHRLRHGRHHRQGEPDHQRHRRRSRKAT